MLSGMRTAFPVFLALMVSLCGQAQDPTPAVSAGRIERMASFHSQYVAARNVDVWLPPGYDGKVRCPVIYMHDGQMLFDPAITWNRASWGMADTMAGLMEKGRIPATIVVGAWSIGPQRFSEYYPEKALGFLPRDAREKFVRLSLAGKPQADNYLRFLVQELKPAIDAKYATLPDRQHTIVMGSSMGGMISLYAVCEYPGVFGAAGCLSTHWAGTFERNATIPLAYLDYLEDHVPDPATHRIYFDHGTATLDALYPEAQGLADVLFREKGYGEKNLQSRVFPGDDHSEASWARRVAIPLEFLDGR
jgi:enterochelin esterase-like enzyme